MKHFSYLAALSCALFSSISEADLPAEFSLQEMTCVSADGETRLQTVKSPSQTGGPLLVSYHGPKESHLSNLVFLANEVEAGNVTDRLEHMDRRFLSIVENRENVSIDLSFVSDWNWQTSEIKPGSTALSLSGLNCESAGYQILDYETGKPVREESHKLLPGWSPDLD